MRSLLKFPLSAVPSGTQIDSADLRLYADQYFGAGSSQTIQAFQATAAWDASTATWSNASSNVGAEGLNEVIVDDSDTTHATASGSWPSASSERERKLQQGSAKPRTMAEVEIFASKLLRSI